MTVLRKSIALTAALLSLLSTGLSQTITMVHEGNSSGSLGGVAFGNTAFTITCSADLGARQSTPSFSGYWMNHTSASIDISGVGSVTVTTPTRTFVNNGVASVGFSRALLPGMGIDLFNGPIHPSLGTWDMLVPIGPLSGTGFTLQWDLGDVVTSGGVLVMVDNGGLPSIFTATLGNPIIGTSYCTAVANSTGQMGSISGQGSEVASLNDVTLTASELPPNSFGFFLTSQTQGLVTNPGGSAGNLCLGGAVGRYVGPGQIQNSGTVGELSLILNLTMTPTPTGFVSVQPGETWNFQAWHRDAAMGSVTSNFTGGLEVVFQ